MIQLKTVYCCTTKLCNIKCKHCYLHDENLLNTIPNGYLDANILDDFLSKNEKVYYLGLSGGEPFIYPDKMFKLLDVCIKHKIKYMAINTNGYWGNDPYITEELKKYKNVKLFVSSDSYHQEFIDLSCIENIIKKDLANKIFVCVFSGDNQNIIVQHLNKFIRKENKKIQVIVLPIKRTLGENDDFSIAKRKDTIGFSYITNQIYTLMPDGFRYIYNSKENKYYRFD